MNRYLQPNVRHSIRPLNVFSFCGQPIAAPRREYEQLSRGLPECPDCKRARNGAALSRGGRQRKLS
jgi:hypothetical protein